MAYVNTIYRTNFLEYSSYVIKERAIPHVDDGLKPVQRRILHSLFEMDDGKFHKVANVVGHCMKYHPHGDASIYEALVVLANKELLIDRQGNFGNLFTGDEASAARYIECRVLPLAKQLLYNPELTGYVDSYDGRNKEPVTYPAKAPLLLVLGAEGIAVGMSTRVLPHNFIEVLEAVAAGIKGKGASLYPDFPTGGLMDVSGYEDGNGRVLVRAGLDLSDPKRVVIRELPPGCSTESMIQSIEAAARKGTLKIAGISDFTTDRVEIEVRLARGTYAEEVVDALYAFTDCEISIPVNLLVIRDNKPAQMTVTEVIAYHAARLQTILTDELRLEQRKLADRIHARTLEQIFVEERIYKQIEQKKTADAVKEAVLRGFDPFKSRIKREITEDDIERLLKIPIRRISLYDINLARRDMEEMRARMKEIAFHLKNIADYALSFIQGIVEAHAAGNPRRTRIVGFRKVDQREAAQRNLRLKYDDETGYLGHGLSGGRVLFSISEFDRVIAIRGSGVYSVMTAPEKVFVEKNLLHVGLADRDELDKTAFSIVYRDRTSGLAFVKRFRVEGYILEKVYQPVPEGMEVLALTTEPNANLRLDLKPAPRSRGTELVVELSGFAVRGLKANGLRLSTRQVTSARFEKRSGRRPPKA